MSHDDGLRSKLVFDFDNNEFLKFLRNFSLLKFVLCNNELLKKSINNIFKVSNN